MKVRVKFIVEVERDVEFKEVMVERLRVGANQISSDIIDGSHNRFYEATVKVVSAEYSPPMNIVFHEF